MERLNERDRIMLGYAYRDPFGNLHQRPPPSSPHHRTSDGDFADVFGGPPRRSSFYEFRRSRADSLDSRSRPRQSSLGLAAEKPVFGELGSPVRRQNIGDDFYDDIFPGSDSGSSTPRKLDRDPFPSLPGSRVLSSNRSVFVGGSSLPPHLSLPKTKLVEGADYPPFGSATHNAPHKAEDGDSDASIFPYSPNASRAVPAPDDLRNSGYAFYRQSPLASQLSRGSVRSSETFSKGSQSERYATSVEGYISSNQFHFSIYRWAGKGVSLSLSSLSKESNNVNKYSGLPEVVIHTVDLPSDGDDDDDDDDMSTSVGVSINQTENQGNKVLKGIFMENKHDTGSRIPDNVSSESESNFLSRTSTGNSGILNNSTEDVSVAVPDAKGPELKNLQFFHDSVDKYGNVTSTSGAGQKDAIDDVKVKIHAQRENFVDHLHTIKPRMKDVPVSLEEKMHGSRVKGKVKEFIKIFNVDGSPKRKGMFDGGDRKSKEKDRAKSKVEVQVSTSTADAEVKTVPTHYEEPFGTDSVEVNEILRRAAIPALYMNSNVSGTKDSSSERDDTSGPNSTSTQEKASVHNVRESNFEDLDGCLVEQLSEEQTDNRQAGLHQDQIQIANAKIQEWSKGREGNIRSLLSTLQYVLWSNSGWKPVPLVDIIEGTSVKRAYQKALLCLHPDKLQQRGAAEDQKYIAEKVFDILQEAWEQFNSIGGV
ncbi:J domain-containing protein required for chloroplast accumulation response 1 [Canna indica]|uniref:J domain-containing protein required for chloroplast accumulation response 1 n=1 Tax=Canna indica TaxID=4628 RepID=A0AAQ3JNX8_9LILI|nr:J domain-containing protein required for chloroplast accumulation response 1 [Canna indica]